MESPLLHAPVCLRLTYVEGSDIPNASIMAALSSSLSTWCVPDSDLEIHGRYRYLRYCVLWDESPLFSHFLEKETKFSGAKWPCKVAQGLRLSLYNVVLKFSGGGCLCPTGLVSQETLSHRRTLRSL